MHRSAVMTVLLAAFVMSCGPAERESEYDYHWDPEIERSIDQSRFSLEDREPREWLLSEQIQAWLICYRDFVSIEGLSDDEKSLENYDVEFYRDRGYWVIRLLRKAALEDSEEVSSSVRAITYWVWKYSMGISRRTYEE